MSLLTASPIMCAVNAWIFRALTLEKTVVAFNNSIASCVEYNNIHYRIILIDIFYVKNIQYITILLQARITSISQER